MTGEGRDRMIDYYHDNRLRGSIEWLIVTSNLYLSVNRMRDKSISIVAT